VTHPSGHALGGGLHCQPTLAPFFTPPHPPTIPVHPFRAHIPDAPLEDLSLRLNAVADILPTYENSFAPESATGENYGLTKDWMDRAIWTWRNEFDWRKVEGEINKFPNYTTMLETRGHTFTVHFVGLFSEREDAVPVVMTHGWPGECERWSRAQRAA
jgi:microsomal epoxide hydrolase